MAQPIPLHERHFSALALRLYAECPLRFRRRYVDGLAIPGLPDDPEERRAMLQGERFHLMARRYYSGLEPGTLGAPADRAELEDWMQKLVRYLPRRPGYAYYPELELRLSEPALRLVARFDLVVVAPDGEATIYDWKTLRHMPPRAKLEAAFQTTVYRYVLCAAGGAYAPGGAFDPDRVSMVYWNPLRGGREERLPYSAARFREDGRRLRQLVAQILATPPDGFPPTGDPRLCARCEYRQLCHGPLADRPLPEPGDGWPEAALEPGQEVPVEDEEPAGAFDADPDGLAGLPLP
ncbi:PD-(D/E)XK nuclease family protein [Symbiobacterium thermophilum]|uniref:PD-(D/E)XK nuclease family protein n=1 Tax=Symbiobacterium thermophilum TaxID=2734 RepID=UPI0002F97570|nr:PD-(D/E)XK nuclease family protein [Symbiobacterium thermophilum]